MNLGDTDLLFSQKMSHWKDELPQDLTLRKEAITDRIKVTEEVNKKIAKCKKDLQEKKARNKQIVDQIRAQGKVATQAIQHEINILDEQIQLKRRNLKDKQTEIQQEIETKTWDLQSDEQKIELEIQRLQRHPKLKSQSEVKALKQEFEQLKLVPIPRSSSNLEQSTHNEHNCPVCSNKPKECHGCLNCDNWVCQDCKEQINYCPHCREDLTQNCLKRNRAVERIITQGNTVFPNEGSGRQWSKNIWNNIFGHFLTLK